jgi:hypothetical protein
MQRRQVEHGVRPEVRHGPKVGRAPDVALDDGQPPGRTRALKVLAPAEAEIVDDQDVVTRINQRIHQVRSDEAGSPGNKYALHLFRHPLDRPKSARTRV